MSAAVRAPPEGRSDGPGKTAKVVVWENGRAQQYEWHWGLPPFEEGGRSYNLLRAEGRTIARPCLVVANHFFVTPDGSKRRYKVNLITPEPFFCFAGVWEPKRPDWPASFAALTVPSSPDIEPLKDRHMAVVRPDEWEAWLRQTMPVEEILRPFPRGSFNVVAPGTASSTGELFG